MSPEARQRADALTRTADLVRQVRQQIDACAATLGIINSDIAPSQQGVAVARVGLSISRVHGSLEHAGECLHAAMRELSQVEPEIVAALKEDR